jgi:hypothetical protein
LKTLPGNSLLKTITLSKKEEIFFIPVKETITGLIPDPRISLLFEATVNGK